MATVLADLRTSATASLKRRTTPAFLIQPTGVAIVVNEPNWIIAQVSVNAATMIGMASDQWVGRSLEALVGETQFGKIQHYLSHQTPGQSVSARIVLNHQPAPLLVMMRILRLASGSLIELEPTAAQRGISRLSSPDARLARQLRAAFARGGADSVPRLAEVLAREVRRISGFDRVAVFRFDQNRYGELLAESRDETVPAFGSRALSAGTLDAGAWQQWPIHRLRLIADTRAAGVELWPAGDEAVDWSGSMLRQPEPAYAAWLADQGIAALMHVAIAIGGRPWGMVAAHHFSGPKSVGHETRVVADTLTEVAAQQLAMLENHALVQAELSAHLAQRQLARHLLDAKDNWWGVLAHGTPSMLGILHADGAAICYCGRVLLTGRTPGAAIVIDLAGRMSAVPQEGFLAIDSVANIFPEVAEIVPSGLAVLAAPLGGAGDYLYWFRAASRQELLEREVFFVETLTAAGDVDAATSPTNVETHSAVWTAAEIGVARALRATVLDIVVRASSRQAAFNEQQYLRARQAVESAADPVIIADATGRVAMLNPAFINVVGWRRDEVANLATMAERFGDPVQASALMHALIAGDGQWRGEVQLVTQAHGLRSLSLVAERVRGEASQVIGYVLLFRDLSETRAAESAIRDLERQVFEVQKLDSLGILAGGIAHDFNNLLVGMLGHASLARQKLEPTSAAQAHLMQIERAAERAADLCGQMLAYAGKGRFVVKPLDLNAIVEEMRQLLHIALPREATFALELDPTLPKIEADPAQIQQVLLNLITNAAAAMSGRAGSIALRTRRLSPAALAEQWPPGQPIPPAESYVSVEVEDSGHGMDEATLARIFEPFFTTKAKGRGLGLAAVEGIVRGHCGATRVVSQVDVGTTFTLFFPALADPTSFAANEEMSAAAARAGEGCILVVDDVPLVRDSAQMMLEAMGFGVMVAADGAAAVDLVRERGGDIRAVLLDMTMPGLSGEQTLVRLRELDHELPIVLSSGYAEEDVTQRLERLPHTAFLQKPYGPRQLQERVQQVMGSRYPD